MTDDARTKRTQTLATAAKAKSQAKTAAAEKAIRTLVKRGEPITFQAVQREADVSHAFLYNHPDLRGRIERLRAGLPLNYAALGLVLDLLDRIHELETALRRRPGP